MTEQPGHGEGTRPWVCSHASLRERWGGSLCCFPVAGKRAARRGRHLRGASWGLDALQLPSPVTPHRACRGIIPFTLGSLEAQRGRASCPRSPSQEVAEMRCEPKDI